MSLNILNKVELEQELENAGDKLVVIDFYANWCAPCKIINPQLQELSQLYGDKAKVLKINVDDCEDIAMDYNVTSMPTFVFIKEQEIIDIVVGGNADKLAKNMEKYIEGGENPIKKFREAQNVAAEEDENLEDLADDPTSMLEVIVDE